MKNFSNNLLLKKVSVLRIAYLIIILAIFLSSSFLIPNSNNITEIDRDLNSLSQIPLLADSDSVLFEGNENALNITDYGNLYKYDQEVSLTNQEELNLNYYLDDVNDWKVSKVETQIKDIKDTRNWINNSGFQPVQIFRKDQIFESAHDYDRDNNPYTEIDHTIIETGAYYLRVHFVNMSFDYQTHATDSDFMVVLNDSLSEVFAASGYREDFYSPWSIGETIHLSYSSDPSPSTTEYGYYIDYYEIINASSNLEVNSVNWKGSYAQSGMYGSNTYGSGSIGDADGMFIGYHGGWYDDIETFVFYENTFTELYQDNIIVPRGKVLDAYLSFDYYVQFALDANNIIMYMKINGEKVYSKGLLDLNSEGKNTWHHTDKVPMYLWINQTNIFTSGDINDQTLNISIGIRNAGSSTLYSGYDDGNANLIWFDNVSLAISTIANSTQDGINLRINTIDLIEKSEWGKAGLNLTDGWDTNPIILNFNTTSPSLSFNLNTILYGNHSTKSRIDQSINEGISYKILENGTIYWEFYHNFYMPSQYSDFEFIISKPKNWEFIYALDPTLQSRLFENGALGDSDLKINKSEALFPGWWSFKATSPNYLDIVNTMMLKQGEWTHTSFDTGESTRIKTQVNYSGEIPVNIESTEVNLTIFDPEGHQWHSEVKSPLSNGTVFFSEITLSALNTTGGQFEYTLFWSNGTALGGLKSSFIVNHQSQIKLLKPDDAKIDLKTDGFVGDIIPVRVILTDAENNLSISDAIVSYNWTGGTTHNFTEAAIGIYETILDTADLSSRGLYEILISSSKLGFLESNLTLEINLGEETNLQRLESEYNIELHANSSIKFKFTDFSGDGIDGATINISISNSSHYSIENLGNGIYNIDFSTLYIDNTGIYHLNFSFSATGYEPQYYVYQFQIIEQSVNLSVFINSVNIQENTLCDVTFFETINVSANAMSIIDKNYISGGTFTWISESYEKNLTEYINYWYNSSIECLPEYFSSGINFIYLKFEHPNYKTQTFGFEILIDRIEFDVDIVGYEDSNPTIKAEIGGSLVLQIELLDRETNQLIENATVLYEWKYGVGELEEITPGTYQLKVRLPENLQGNFIFNLIISKEGTVYKTTQSSFLLVIGEPQFPIFLIWIIIIISALIISALGILSLRSYVILPRRRKREAELLARTQRFKDIENIQAIVAIHRDSGIPLYSKSYSILEKHKKELFSGFIQAIITVGKEMVGRKGEDLVEFDEEDGGRTILELDFKYFYCLICDRQDLRVIFILTERASDRMKRQISDLSLGAMLELSEQIENWDGAIHEFEVMFPPIINNYVDLYIKEPFTINNAEFIAKLRKEGELNSMETRILNVLYSIVKSKREFYLKTIFEIIHEKNRDIVIDGIEGLIKKQVIIPTINTIN